MKKEVKNHWVMKLNKRDEFLLFMDQLLGQLCCKKVCPWVNWKRRDKILKMFTISKERYQKELSVYKIVKSLYLMRTMLKNSFLTDEMKYNCIHSNKGTIHLDDSDDCNDQSHSDQEQPCSDHSCQD